MVLLDCLVNMTAVIALLLALPVYKFGERNIKEALFRYKWSSSSFLSVPPPSRCCTQSICGTSSSTATRRRGWDPLQTERCSINFMVTTRAHYWCSLGWLVKFQTLFFTYHPSVHHRWDHCQVLRHSSDHSSWSSLPATWGEACWCLERKKIRECQVWGVRCSPRNKANKIKKMLYRKI